MSITSYSTLKSAVADFLLRSDLTSVIPTFISLAEADMNRRLRHWRMEGRSTATLDTQYSVMPADFLEAIRYKLLANPPISMELISQAEMSDRRAKYNDTAGAPQYYAVTGGQFEVFPTPDSAYTSELSYYKRMTPLSDSNVDNWALTYHPDVYLYGTLAASAPYLQDDQRLNVWAALYQNAVDGINNEGQSAKYGGSGLRMKIRSY